MLSWQVKKCWLLFLCLPFVAKTQNFRNIDVVDGLPSTVIYSIDQDNSSNLWIGTFGGGICVYNGKNFRYINTSNGLNSDQVRKVFVDKDSNCVWAGTSAGLNLITRDSIYDLSQKIFGDPLEVIDITKDENKAMWFTTTRGIFSYDGKKTTHYTKTINSDKKFSTTIFSQLINPKGESFFGFREGLAVLENGVITTFSEKDGLPGKTVTSLTRDSKGKVLIGTTKGICYFEEGKIIRPKEDPLCNTNLYVRTLLYDKKGVLWIGTKDHLVSYDKSAKFKFFGENEGLLVDEVRCLFLDKEEDLWLGTLSGGLFKHLDNNIKRYGRFSGLMNEQIIDITKDKKNTIWLLTRQGIGYLNEKDSFIYLSKSNKLKDLEVAKFTIDSSNTFWLATNKGLLRTQNDFNFRYFTIGNNSNSNVVNSVFVDRKGFIWAGYRGGVKKINPKDFTEEAIVKSLANTFITGFHQSNDSCIWILTGDGFSLYKNGEIENIRVINGKKPGLITSMTKDFKGNFWCTTNTGMCVYNGHDLNFLTRNNGLPTNEYHGLIAIDSFLYTSTDMGLLRINLNNFYRNGSLNLKLINRAHGLSDDKISKADLFYDGNFIWLATQSGVFRFAESIEKAKYKAPALMITDVKLFYNSVFNSGKNYLFNEVKSDKLIFKHKQNYITFDFIGILFSDNERITYKYRLVGLNDSFSPETHNNSATFTNLSSGEYTFEVMAKGTNGIWSSPSVFHFQIVPPFYKTTWFYLACSGFILIVLFFYIKFRERSIRSKNEELERKVSERTEQLIKQKILLENTNLELAHKSYLINESIEYARHIQQAILPEDEYINLVLEQQFNWFVYFSPKDVVSGDFYFVDNIPGVAGKKLIAAVDCTGHGVPGAFLTIIVNNLLSKLISDSSAFESTEHLLNKLNESFDEYFAQKDKDDRKIKDNYAISILLIDTLNKQLVFSGVNQSLIIVRNNELITLKTSRKSDTPFYKLFHYQKEDCIYLFTDGYIDQKGETGKTKYFSKRFKSFLLQLNSEFDFSNHKEIIRTEFERHKGSLPQTDDVLIIGLKVK